MKYCSDGELRLNLASYRTAIARRRKMWLYFVAISSLLAASFFLAYQFPSIQTYGVSGGPSSQAQRPQYQLLAQTAQPSASIVLEAETTSHYSLFNLNIPENVNGTMVATSLSLSNDSQVSMVTSFKPSHIKVLDTLTNGTTISLPVSIQKGLYAAFVGYQFTVPASSSNFTMTVKGVQNAESFLYRQVAYIPFMSVSGLPNVTKTYSTLIAVPYHSVIANAYTYGGPGGQ